MTDQKVTIYTIAKKLGVSPSAVSRAFNPKTKLKPEKRELILQTAYEMGYQPNLMASRLSGETIRICVILFSRVEAYIKAYLPGIRDAEHSLSGYKVTCDIYCFDEDNYNRQEFLALFEKDYDGYIICPWDLYDADLQEALSLNKPMVLLDSGIKECPCISVSRGDGTTSGSIVAQLFSMTIRKPNPNIAIFASVKERPSQKKILTSFCESAKQFGLGSVSIFESVDDHALAARQIVELYEDHVPDGIYITTANSIPICRFLKQNDRYRDTVLITSDVYSELNDYVRSGVVAATIYQNPYQQAYNALHALALHLINDEPLPEEILVSPTIVLKSNLHLYELNDR